TDTEILVDRVLPVPPEQESAQRGDAPVLLPLLQLTRFAVSQLLILVDRSGADLHLRARRTPPSGRAPTGWARTPPSKVAMTWCIRPTWAGAARTAGGPTTTRPGWRTPGSATPTRSPRKS